MRARLSLITIASVAVALAIAPAAPAAYRLYANNYSDSSISGFTIGPDGALAPVPGSPLPTAGHFPQSLTAAPDGRFIIAGYPFGTDELIQSLAVGSDGALSDASGFVSSPDGPYGAAFAPGTRLAYAGYQSGMRVYELSATGTISELPGSPVASDLTGEPAITPNGKHLYAGGTAPTRLKRFDIQPGGLPSFAGEIALAYDSIGNFEIAPDGRFLYLTASPGGGGNDKVEAFSIAADGSLTSIGSVTGPDAVGRDLAIGPDGRFLYYSEGNSDTVTIYAIQPNGGLAQVDQVVIGLGGVQSLAITPDGRFLYAQRDSGTGTIKVYAISANGAISPTGATGTVGDSDGTTLAIPPDQSPNAALSVTTKPGKQVFDGSGSTDSDGIVAGFEWDFGDGTKQSSSAPTVDHTYKKAGNFTVLLRVIDNAGCSRDFIGTGQTIYCSGNAGAELKRQIVSPVPSIESLSVTRKRFAAKSARAETTARRKRRVKTGTTFRYRLDRAAAVKFTIEQRIKGRRVGKKCRTKTKKNARRKSCVLYKRKGTLSARGKTGVNRKRFNGRLRKRALRAGRYRATAVATTTDKFKSAPKRVSFRIVRR